MTENPSGRTPREQIKNYPNSPKIKTANISDWRKYPAICVTQDMFTRSRCIVSLFDDLTSVNRNSGWAESPGDWLDQNCDRRIVFSNPYRDLQTTALYNLCRARKQPICVIERGPLPGTLLIDGTGFLVDSNAYNFSNSDEVNFPENWQDVIRNYKLEYLSAGDSLEFQIPDRVKSAQLMERLTQSMKKPAILIALQMPDDTVTRHFCHPGRSYQTFLTFCQACIKQFSDRYTFVYKPHPRAANLRFDDADNLMNVHIDDALAKCAAVLTFNSGVGVLAMMHDKPVAVFGRAYYASAQSITTVADMDDMCRFLESLVAQQPQTQSDSFLFHLTQRVLSHVIYLPKTKFWIHRKVGFLPQSLRVYDGVDFHSIETGIPTSIDLVRELMSASARYVANRFTQFPP
jgi:Capsule polysaccharide biosynthesis protein